MYLEQIVLEGLSVDDSLLDLIVGRHPNIMREIDWLICHQASGLLQHHLASTTGLPLSKIPFHVDRLGNTMTASTGVAIDKLRTDGALNKGDLVLVIAAGTSWRTAAYLMQW